jgi:hypothetical protein
MLSSWMLCCVALVRTDVSEEHITFIIRVTRISELGTLLAVTSNRSMLWRNSVYNILICLHRMLWLLVTANVTSSSPIPVTLNMKVIHSSKTSVSTRATKCNIQEDDILHSHHHENQKSYNIKCLLHKKPQLLSKNLLL